MRLPDENDLNVRRWLVLREQNLLELVHVGLTLLLQFEELHVAASFLQLDHNVFSSHQTIFDVHATEFFLLVQILDNDP